jgi:hypothetical protein
MMSSESDVLGYHVPTALLSQIFSTLLLLKDICRFDSAICNVITRPLFFECIQSESCICMGDKDQDLSSKAISWLRYRSIKIRHLKCSRINDDIAIKIGAFESCLRLLSIRYENGFYDDRNKSDITDTGMASIAGGCLNLQCLDLSYFSNITYISMNMIAEICSNLISLDLRNCYHIADKDIVKLSEKCLNLLNLDLSECFKITDIGVAGIAHGCPLLNTLNLGECEEITDMSIIKIVEGCPNLHNYTAVMRSQT